MTNARITRMQVIVKSLTAHHYVLLLHASIARSAQCLNLLLQRFNDDAPNQDYTADG